MSKIESCFDCGKLYNFYKICRSSLYLVSKGVNCSLPAWKSSLQPGKKWKISLLKLSFSISILTILITATLLPVAKGETSIESDSKRLGCLEQLSAPDKFAPQAAGQELSLSLDEPVIEAFWYGPTQWMVGNRWSYGETFYNSIGKGKYFFGSNLPNSDYVPV